MNIQSLISTATNRQPTTISTDVIYTGKRTRTGVSVKANGEKLSPRQSLKIVNHSPSGFEWGYCGSGPSQLALALLLDATGDQSQALNFYQQFKADHVSSWGDVWEISRAKILEWIAEEKRRRCS